MSDEQLDLEIDRAVREMMSVDAPGGFRARILSKLDERPRRIGWMTVAGLGALGTAAAVALLMVRGPDLVVPRTGPDSAPSSPAVSSAPRTGSGPVVKTPPDPAPRSDTRGTPSGRVSREQEYVVAAVAAAEPESTVAALSEIEPLFLPPVMPRALQPAAIAIAPLAVIPQVRVDPLSPPQGRD